jgi:RNA polymerase sigma factor (sigma-70 family)
MKSTLETLQPELTLALQGDRGAVERLLRGVRPFIARLALRFFGCPSHAEDATQEVLIQLLTRLDRFEGQSSFTTWVYRVATNKFISMKRSPAERESLSVSSFEEELSAPLSKETTDEALLLTEIRVSCTLAMLLCLEREARMTYILGAIIELDHQSAAEILGCSPATYRKRLERARATITGLMRRRCGVFDAQNHCQCAGRVTSARSRGRLDPENLLFATSTEQAKLFPDVLVEIRRLDELQRATALYQSHPEPRAREDITSMLREALGVPQD